MLVYLEAVIGPRTELQDTCLLVEREVLHVDFTGRLINGWRLPLNQSLMVDCGLRGQGHLEVSVRAASEHISGSGRCGGRAYFVLPIQCQAHFLKILSIIGTQPSFISDFKFSAKQRTSVRQIEL